MRFDLTLVVLALPFLTSRLQAVGGTITDDAASFVRTSYGASPAADFTGVSSTPSQDHVSETGWWYRIVGDAQETPFPNPTTEDYSLGDRSELTWSDLGGRGLFEAVENDQVTDASAELGHASGYVYFQMGIHNISAGTITLVLYHYIDVDLAGVSDDSAAYMQKTPHEAIDLSDVSDLIGQYDANFEPTQILPGNVFYRVGEASTLEASLNDGSITGGANSGLPFGPGDFGGSYRFVISVNPGQTVFVDTALGVGLRVYCGEVFGIFCDGFETGSQATFWLP